MSESRSKSLRVLAWTFAGIVVVGAFGVGVAYALGCFDPNPKIAVQQELTTKLTAVGEKLDNRQRLSVMKDVGEKIRSLPEDLRRPLGEQMQKMMTQHINRVMAMAPAEQAAAMDKDIELIQMMSQEVEKRRAEKAAQQGDKTGGGGGDPNQSNAGRNRMLSSIPADQRANWSNNRQLFQAYQVMLQNRATQRGIAFPAIGQR
jgi:hypothetical protein